MKRLFILSSAILVSTLAHGSVIISQWNFNSNPSDANTATGSIIASTGAGTVNLIGGLAALTFAGGVGSSDTAAAADNSGLQTSGYPAQSASSGTSGVVLSVSTASFLPAAYTGLEVKFDLRISNTASRWYRLDYTTDAGATWNLGAATRLGTAANGGDTWYPSNSVSITDPAALGNANFQTRVVSVFSGNAFTEASSSTNFAANAAYEVARNTTSAYGGGTWRFDMMTVTAVPEPSVVLLGGISLLGLLRRRR